MYNNNYYYYTLNGGNNTVNNRVKLFYFCSVGISTSVYCLFKIIIDVCTNN